ncbi:MAG: retropepsin-like aspartic protease [Rhabdochlamydiaceae bacterium]
MFIVAKIQKRYIRIMIDSGATGNFITEKVATACGFLIQRKKDPYPLMVVDGEPISSNNGMVTHETVAMEMVMLQGHREMMQFDIINMGNHACILGVPWLRKHNPQVNWRDDTIVMSQCACEQRTDTPHLRRENASLS